MSVFGVILFRIFPYSNWKCIQSECREMRTRITPNKDNFSRSERVPFFQRTARLYGLLSFSLTNHFIISTFPWFSIIKISCSNEFNHISREFYSCWYQHKRQKYPGLLPGFYIQRKLPECILSTGIVQSQQWKPQNNVWNLFKVTIRTSEWRQWRRSGVSFVNFEQISQIVLM